MASSKNYEQICETESNAGSSAKYARYSVKRKIDGKSLKTKYQALMAVEKGDKTKSTIARQFGVPANTLSTWLKSKDKIKSCYESSIVNRSRKKMRCSKYGDTETALLKWFTDARSHRVPVSGPMLKARAEKIAKDKGELDFKCSTGWLDRFKGRHAIRFIRTSEQKSLDIHTEPVIKFTDTQEQDDDNIEEIKVEQNINDPDDNIEQVMITDQEIKTEQVTRITDYELQSNTENVADHKNNFEQINNASVNGDCSNVENLFRSSTKEPTLEMALEACDTLSKYFKANGSSPQIIQGLLKLPDKVLKQLIINRLQKRSGVSDFFSVYVCVKDLEME